jgi:hypothetical protein
MVHKRILKCLTGSYALCSQQLNYFTIPNAIAIFGQADIHLILILDYFDIGYCRWWLMQAQETLMIIFVYSILNIITPMGQIAWKVSKP